MIEAWEQAKQISSNTDYLPQQTLNIDGDVSLWNPILVDWLVTLKSELFQ